MKPDWVEAASDLFQRTEELVEKYGHDYIFQHWVVEDVRRLRERIEETYGAE